MAYKDKDRQRQANKEAVRRHRAKQKGITLPAPSVIPEQGSTFVDKAIAHVAEHGGEVSFKTVKGKVQDVHIAPSVIPNYGQPDCQCMHCKQNRTNGSRHTLNHGPRKLRQQLGKNELNRVSLPGDPDYAGVGLYETVAESKGVP